MWQTHRSPKSPRPGVMYCLASRPWSTQAVMTLSLGNLAWTFLMPSGEAIRLRKRMRSSLTPCSRRTSMALRHEPPVAGVSASTRLAEVESQEARRAKPLGTVAAPRRETVARGRTLDYTTRHKQTHRASGRGAGSTAAQCHRAAWRRRVWAAPSPRPRVSAAPLI